MQFEDGYVGAFFPKDAAVSIQGNRIHRSQNHVVVPKLAEPFSSSGPGALRDFFRYLSLDTPGDQKSDGAKESILVSLSIHEWTALPVRLPAMSPIPIWFRMIVGELYESQQ